MNPANVLFLGHSTVMITSESGKRILVDPWLEGNPSCPAHLYDPGTIDLVCLTHGHSDHASSAVAIAQKYHCPVVATFELLQLLVREGLNPRQICPMNKGGTIEALPNIHTSLTHALHSNSFDSSTGTEYAGEACGLVIRLESGRCVYHAGDTALFSDMRLIGETYQPVLSLLPIGDRFTMGPKEAARAIEFLGCRLIIPIHWGTFPLLSGTPADLKKHAAALDCRIVELLPGNDYTF